MYLKSTVGGVTHINGKENVRARMTIYKLDNGLAHSSSDLEGNLLVDRNV